MALSRIKDMKQNRFPRKLFGITMLLALSMGVLAPWSAAQGEGESPGITLVARAGFDGYAKRGQAIPIYVDVANNGPDVEGILRVAIDAGAGGDPIRYDAPLSLPSQSYKQMTLYVHMPSLAIELQVDLVDENGRLLASARTNSPGPGSSSARITLISLGADDLLYGVVSSEPGELDFLERVTGLRGRASVAFLDLTELPEVPSAWDMLDVLVLDNVDSGTLTAEQFRALGSWITLGGQLVVTGGPGWQKSTAGLTDLLPVTVTGSQSVDDLPSLTAWAGVPFRDPGPYLVATSSLQSGELLLYEEGLPLLARRSLGRGAIYFLALDPKLAPLQDWDGSELLWSEVAASVPDLPSWGQGIKQGYAASTAVSSLPSLALPSVLQLVMFLLLYVIVVGPINYRVLKRYGRRELAWATIPGLVLLFSGIAYVTGFQLKGNETIINQMSIAYGPTAGEHMRVQTLVGLYSPRRERYDMQLPGDTLVRPFERNFGSLTGGGNFEAIVRDNDLTVDGIRVDVSGTETFIVDSYRETANIRGEAVLTLNGNDIELEVEVHNGSDFLLENVTVLVGIDALSLGDIRPGQSRSVSKVVATAGSAGTPSMPGPAAGPIYVPGPGGGSTLINQAHVVLGTSNYYNDPEVYPRFQLLQALEGDMGISPITGGKSGPSGSSVVTLVAWSEEPLLEIGLSQTEFGEFNTTLYLLEVPVDQRIVAGNSVSIPPALLQWEALDGSGNYQPYISNLYLQSGWVEFEFRPWSELTSIQVSQLSIVLAEPGGISGQSPPQLRIWDWDDESWKTLGGSGWGTIRVSNPEHYVGPAAAVRIRIQENAGLGVQIKEVYPILTGDLE